MRQVCSVIALTMIIAGCTVGSNGSGRPATTQAVSPPTTSEIQPQNGRQAEAMTVWVDRKYSSRANTLHTELKINGQLVDVFSSDTFKPIDKYLQKGENTFIFRTFQNASEDRRNELIFRIGPIRKDEKRNQRVMDPVLWEFRNRTDLYPPLNVGLSGALYR